MWANLTKDTHNIYRLNRLQFVKFVKFIIQQLVERGIVKIVPLDDYSALRFMFKNRV